MPSKIKNLLILNTVNYNKLNEQASVSYFWISLNRTAVNVSKISEGLKTYSPHFFHSCCYYCPVKSFFLEQQANVKLSQLGKLADTNLQGESTQPGQIFLLQERKK